MFVLIYEIIMNLTVGAIHWVYIPEICSDIQFGFIATVHYLNGIEVSLVSEWMFKYMTPAGTFLFYFTITFTGFFLMIKYVKETRGLSDKEKKQLYKT